MVARSEDKPRTVTERISDASRRLDEVNRALGRGSPTLYNDAGHLLTLDVNSSTPFLVPRDTDSAFRFDQGKVAIVDPTGTEDRDMTVRDITSSGEVHANRLTATGQVQADNVGCNVLGVGTVNASQLNGNVSGGTVTSTGQLNGANLVLSNQINAGGFCYITGGQQIGQAEVPVGGRLTCREITTEGNVHIKGNLFLDGVINPATSERRLKNHVDDITNGLEVIRALKPSVFTWKDPGHRDSRRHVGVYVDEFADVAPDAIVDPGEPGDVPTTDTEHARKITDGRGYEDRALIAYLVAAVQELTMRVQTLEQP